MLDFEDKQIQTKLKLLKKDYIIKDKDDVFFNFSKFFLFDSKYIFKTKILLKIEKKKNWWRKIFFKRKFKENLNFGYNKAIRRHWIRYVKYFPKIYNKYDIYIRYFYTYKSLKV